MPTRNLEIRSRTLALGRMSEKGPGCVKTQKLHCKLQHDTPLTGDFERSTVDAVVAMAMQVIDDAREEEAERRQGELGRQGLLV